MKEKTIETVEYWGKSEWATIGLIAHNFGKDTDWVCQKRIMVEGAYYQLFSNIKDCKYKWLLKLWIKLNNL